MTAEALKFPRPHSHRAILRPLAFRGLSSTTPCLQDNSFSDPTRPDLFYHLVPAPAHLTSSEYVFAVSFLETPPSSPESDTILGWIPTNAGDEAGLNDFKENPYPGQQKFVRLLHAAVSSGLHEGIDDIQINGAQQLQQGWMHVHDTRNVPALGRIGDPDDIIGSVLVEDSKILPETYSPMPSYRVCTADGVPKLTDGLAQKLRDVLVARAREEAASR